MNEINFLPRAYVIEQMRQRRVRREFALIAMAIMVMAGWFLIAQARMDQLSFYTQEVESQAQVMREQVKQAIDREAQRTVLSRQFRIQRELAPALSYSQVLATIGALLPRSMAIRDLSMLGRQPTVDLPSGGKSGGGDASAAQAPDRQPDAIRITLVGVAPSDTEVANFVGALADHPLFANVKLLYCKSAEVGPLLAREYRIEVEVPLDRQFKPRKAGTEVAHAF
ncbi:MAG: PilN domain-containing protein [Phycisphaeraceae bacterium]